MGRCGGGALALVAELISRAKLTMAALYSGCGSQPDRRSAEMMDGDEEKQREGMLFVVELE